MPLKLISMTIKKSKVVIFILYFLSLIFANFFAQICFRPSGLLKYGNGFFYYFPFPILDIHYMAVSILSLGILMSALYFLLFSVLLLRNKEKLFKLFGFLFIVNLLIIFIFRFLEIKELIHSSYFSFKFFLH